MPAPSSNNTRHPNYRIVELMMTRGMDIDARSGPDPEVPSGDIKQFDLPSMPLYRHTLNLTGRGTHIDTHTPWPLRFKILEEYFAHHRTRDIPIDGIHLSQLITSFWMSCSLMPLNSFDQGDTIYGWPSFLQNVSHERRVYRKWVKNEEAIQQILSRGLVAAHNSCLLYDKRRDMSWTLPYIEGTFLANPEDPPKLSNHSEFSHYVDFLLPRNAGVLKLSEHKYVVPGMARVHEEDILPALTENNYTMKPSPYESPIIGCVRMFGDQFPVPFLPVDIVGYGNINAAAAAISGAATCMGVVR